MTTQQRLRKIEDTATSHDPAIWIARQIEQADFYTVTKPHTEGRRQMTRGEIEQTLTGTVVFVVRSTKKGGL